MAELERAQIIARVAPALPLFGMLIENALREACGHTAETGAAVIQNRVSLGVSAVGAQCPKLAGAAPAFHARLQCARQLHIGAHRLCRGLEPGVVLRLVAQRAQLAV